MAKTTSTERSTLVEEPHPTLNFQAFIESITPGYSQLDMCIQCGSCGGSCPSAADMDHTPRGLFALIGAEEIDEVLESLVIGQEWGEDVRVVLFVRLREDAVLDEALETALRERIRRGASPRHVPAKIIAVADIPRTISGKISELAVREVVHGRPVKNADALANPEALGHFRDLPALQD